MFEHDEFDPGADEYGFWKDVPTGRLERLTQRLPRITRRHDVAGWPDAGDEPAPHSPKEHTSAIRRPTAPSRPAGSRQHGDTTQSIPVVAESVGQRVRAATQHVDPLLRRVGALAVVIALAVPVALAMRGSDGRDAGNLSPAAGNAASESTAAELGADAAATTALDPRALPPATYSARYTATSQVGAEASADGRSSTAAPPASATSATAPAAPATPAVTATATTEAKQVEAVGKGACTKQYTVVAGDYWILVAKKVSVSLSQLLAANNATTKTGLYPGRVICLPANASAPTTVAPPTTAKPTTTTTKPPTTTVPPTTTKPPTVTVPVKTNYTRAEVEAIIRQIWPDDLEDMAVLIAIRESNLVPTAKNYCCYGLFQIYWNVHKGWLANIGVTSSQQLFDPRVNAFAALIMYNRAGGWGPWKL